MTKCFCKSLKIGSVGTNVHVAHESRVQLRPQCFHGGRGRGHQCTYRAGGGLTWHIMFSWHLDVKSPACKCLNIHVCNERVKSLLPASPCGGKRSSRRTDM